jgi:hypothetical protein
VDKTENRPVKAGRPGKEKDVEQATELKETIKDPVIVKETFLH